MNQKPKLQGWQDFTNTSKFTNQLRILSDSLNQTPRQTKHPNSPFNNVIIKKCLTQQSQSPNQRRNPYRDYQQYTCNKKTYSPVSKEQLFNFSSEKTQKETNIKFNVSNQPKQMKQSPVVRCVQRYQKQQLRNKLLMISKDLNNTQINHIIQLIYK
ncbi:unnamed protein product [Paramecium primaurelia]|uniref:Uncharacterized protein n=1 Tax=Paramecium primaurelia TaxID=5886 RepID=A0A8S1NR00_PARPR|nr:unnamed protein product [Paramecium primaurelia]